MTGALKKFFVHRIAYIEFKTEAEAEKMLEEAQGADLQGRSIMVDYVGDKSQKGARMSCKHLTITRIQFTLFGAT